MRQSGVFIRSRKEGPKDEVSKNAELLIRAGFINKEMAGVYSLLPFGLKVIENIKSIIRKEMMDLNAQEVRLTTLQSKELWQATDRWNDDKVDIWFKTEMKNGTEVGLALTHEEPLTNLLKNHIHSYKDLPVFIFQFQTKFRNELRAKSGILRGREFEMKDLYSFCTDVEQHNNFYEKVKNAYARIFKKVGLGDITFPTYASGGVFSKYSMEFQTLTQAGEDIIYVDKDKHLAINEEIINDDILKEFGLKKDNLNKEKAVEVGNIFDLGVRFSSALDLNYVDDMGAKKPVYMGSYGIGLGRLMGTIVEVLSDEDGIVWPKEVSPFEIHLLNVCPDDEEVKKIADSIYEELNKDGGSVLYDDRQIGAGERFADADLMGMPKQIIVGRKTLESGEVEIKDRASGKRTFVKRERIKEAL